MKKVLGIDTGGTYTDIAVVSAEKKEILFKYKTLTTKYKLTECIADCFAQIPEHMAADISTVCLSTTLATNAIVENQGCKDGLILIGARPRGKLESAKIQLIKGRYDIKGRIRENLDIEEVRRAVDSFRGKADAIAISGYASVRNPEHEIYVKQVVQQRLGIPAVCAHELTTSLGFYDRTVTANLNAKLIPMVCELMEAVKASMERYKIYTPMMIVKGDGTLMTDVCARSKPIDTILSGPAASIIGGKYLSGQEDALIMDMGGTTTDIANVCGGKVSIRNEGAKVGGWFTHVRAAEIFTAGIGGDSRILINSSGEVRIGPEKSIPLTQAAEAFPELTKEMRFILKNQPQEGFSWKDHEAYQMIRKYENLTYSDDERVIIEVLRYMPHTKDYLQKNIHIGKLQSLLDGLVQSGVIARISLTPTDILHVAGTYKKWDPAIAELLLEIAETFCGITKAELIRNVRQEIIERLDSACIQAAIYFDHQELDMQEGGAYDYFLNKLFFQKGSEVLQAEYHLPKKIIGIGAPAKAWLEKAGKKLHTQVIVPEHAEVANAVGAAVGRAIETIEILIRPDQVSGKFLVYSPLNRVCRDTLEEATQYAEAIGVKCIEDMSENRKYHLKKEIEDICFEDSANDKTLFMERQVILSAHFELDADRAGAPERI